MRWADIPDDSKERFVRQNGCTFEGCDTGEEIWVWGQREEGGLFWALCETHIKQIFDLDVEDREEWLERVGFARVLAAGIGYMN